MRIQYFSDIHLEFLKTIPKIQPTAPILCLLGDIGHPFSEIYENFLIDVNNKFKKIFLVAGNHEYYSKKPDLKEYSVAENNEKIKLIIKKHNLDKISFLNNSYEYYDDHLFAGTVLWSNIKDKNYLSNDTIFIKDITVNDINMMHNDCVDFLKKVLKNNSDKKIIVLSHFLPSYTLIDEKYLSLGKICQCFASNNDDIIIDPIKLWLYGHTHTPKKSIINNIPVICNPIGYSGQNKNVNFEEIIEF